MKKYFLILLAALVSIPAYADQKEQKTYGKTYGEWSVKWAQWAFAGPKGQNAIEDLTGEFCAENQPRRDIWFLAGSFGKTGVNRSCTIPPNRALFYPLIEGGWIDCPGTADEDVTDLDVRKIVASGTDAASLLTSTLDGVAISSLQILTVRTQSPKFTAILPINHVMGDPGCGFILPAGKTGRQIIEGYWVMLQPLTPGIHVLTLRGAKAKWSLDDKGVNHGVSTGWSFDNEVTYNLTVLGEHQHDHHHK